MQSLAIIRSELLKKHLCVQKKTIVREQRSEFVYNLHTCNFVAVPIHISISHTFDRVMISGSESIDLYYLKYFVDSNTTNRILIADFESGRRSDNYNYQSVWRNIPTSHQSLAISNLQPQPPPPATPPPPTASCCGIGAGSTAGFVGSSTPVISATIETLNMLIGRLAIILSLVGWRVKPDPGD